MTFFSAIIVLVFFLFNVISSNLYVYPRLCRFSTTPVRVTFVATFALSFSLLQLCLWEINASLEDQYDAGFQS